MWREIALFLPRRDLRSLLFVSNTLSCIASQLPFREIDLHLTATLESGDAESAQESIDQDVDTWHLQRSVDILTRILVDPHFTSQVRGLRIFAVSHDTTQNLTFQVGMPYSIAARSTSLNSVPGMLMNVLPKLSNLCKVHCSGSIELITRMLQTVQSYHPRLQSLSLVYDSLFIFLFV